MLRYHFKCKMIAFKSSDGFAADLSSILYLAIPAFIHLLFRIEVNRDNNP